MNILHIDEQLGWRGGEQQASWLIQGLVAKGHHLWIAGRKGAAFLKSAHGDTDLTRIALPFWAELDLYTAWKLAQLVYTEQIDIIHAHTSHTHTIACLAGAMARRGAVVVSRRVSFPPKRDRLNRWKYNAPDAIIAVSGKVAEVLLAAGVPRGKVRRVYSAVDLDRLKVEAADRASLGVSGKAPLLLSAGALVGHKDHANLIEAMPAVREAISGVRLLVAGEGELREALEKQIAELGLGNTVSLLGHRDDVPALMRAADCYVSSSWSEGLGTSVLEALACETPVVAAEAGGIAEMIRPAETGFLVENRDPAALAEAIIEALGSRANARKMAKAGRALVKSQFTTGQMVEGTMKIYLELAARMREFGE